MLQYYLLTLNKALHKLRKSLELLHLFPALPTTKDPLSQHSFKTWSEEGENVLLA